MSAPATKQPLAPPSRERGPSGSAGPSAGPSRGDALRTQLKAASFAEGEALLSAGGDGGAAPVQLKHGPTVSAAPDPSTKRAVGEKDSEPDNEAFEECMKLQRAASEGADLETLIQTIAGKYKYLLEYQAHGVRDAHAVLSKPEPPTLLEVLFSVVDSLALVSIAGWAGGLVKDRVKQLLQGSLGSGNTEGAASALASMMQKVVTESLGHSWAFVSSKVRGNRGDPLAAFIETQHASLIQSSSVAEASFFNHGGRALRADKNGLAVAQAQLEALNEMLCGSLRQKQQNATLDAWVRFVAARSQLKEDDQKPAAYSPEEVSPSDSNDGVLEVHVDARSPLEGDIRVRGLTLPGVNPAVLGAYSERASIGEIEVPKVIKVNGAYFPHEARSRGPKSMVGFPFFASMLKDSGGGMRLEIDGPGRAWLKLYFHGKGPERRSGTRDEDYLASLPDAYVERGARKLYHHIMQLRP